MSRPVPLACLVTAALLSAVPAIAGPPLLCHPFDIGDARSLPWNGRTGWADARADYDLEKLVPETQALLVPATPIVVRMETLRRAAIYASRDPEVAARLVASLVARTRDSGRIGKTGPLALLDAAYLVEALRQMTRVHAADAVFVSKIMAIIRGQDGYSMIERSLELRPDDPALEFAAALIAADRNRAAYEGHARRARAGAGRDALLALNIGHISS